jgi:thiol-disulfide isomerase/thioredoxin
MRLLRFSALLGLALLLLPSAAGAQITPGAPPAQEGERELQRAIAEAGNDRAALVRNLEDYLRRFPDAPRRPAIYRALVEAYLQLRERAPALDYAERLIALEPADIAMMLLAAELLEQAGDDRSLTRATGYLSRVLDQLEKSPAAAGAAPRPPDPDQRRAMASVLGMRGRIEMTRRNYDSARLDLAASFALASSAPAAQYLGELAEIRGDYTRAVEYYAAAFFYGGDESDDPFVASRAELRWKLGNAWRLSRATAGAEDAPRGSLGDKMLEAFDRLLAEGKPAAPPTRNDRAQEFHDFVLRTPGGGTMALAEARNKVVVLNFWATWCRPCRELAPLFEQAMTKYAGRDDVVFLAVNVDEEEDRVAPYVARERIRAAVVFADGLERFLRVESLPAVLVLDRQGKSIYRREGFSPDNLLPDISAAIDWALAAQSAPGEVRPN